MHRQQKTFTPSSFILPLIVTALVIFLAAEANAQTSEPAVELPPNVEDFATPTEARLAAPVSGTAPMDLPVPTGVLPTNRSTVDIMNRSVSNTSSTTVRTSSSTMRTEWAEAAADRQAALERKRAELASSTIARRAALNAEAQARMVQLAERSAGVLQGALTKIKNISSNLRDRAESISSRGVDTTEAITLLNQADDLITQAESSLSGIDINIEYTLTSETPREDWVEARTQFQTSVEIIRTIRPLLQQVVSSLREAIKNAGNTSVEPI